MGANEQHLSVERGAAMLDQIAREGTLPADAPLRSAPEPLRGTLAPAEEYPVDALGEVLGGAARALHQTIKAPIALCCQSVLASASLAVQAHFDVVLPWGQRRPTSLFLLTVGKSGERKSAVDDIVLGAARKRERLQMEAYELDRASFDLALESWTKAAEAARSAAGKKPGATAADLQKAVTAVGEKPIAPIVPLRFVSDPTVEGLYKLLALSQPSVALFSDEGGLLIGGHALNSDNALKTMARWSKMWDGSPFDRVRAGDGAGILYGRRMAMHQQAQPEVMATLLSDRKANDQGLLARCLVAWPTSTIGTRTVDRFEQATDRPEVKRLFAVLSELMEAEPRGTEVSPQELDPVELPLSAEASDLAIRASNAFETLQAPGADLAELTDRASKAMENACRIAAILAVIESKLATREIGAAHLSRALVLVQWYLSEALRIRSAAMVPQAVLDAETLLMWLEEKKLRAFRTRQVLNGGPLRDKPRLTAAIGELVACGYLIENPAGTEVDGVKARKSWQVLHYVV